MKYIITKDFTKSYDVEQLEEIKAYYRFDLKEEKENLKEAVEEDIMTKEDAERRFLELIEFNKDLDECENIFAAAVFLNSKRDFADIYEEFVIKEYDF